jgi:hypothetical protein
MCHLGLGRMPALRLNTVCQSAPLHQQPDSTLLELFSTRRCSVPRPGDKNTLLSWLQMTTNYLMCLDRLKAGTATIEYINDEEGTVRVQAGNSNHVLTNLNQQQLAALRTAAQQGK